LTLHIVCNCLAATRPAVPLSANTTSLTTVAGETNARVVVVAELPWVTLSNGIGIGREDAEVLVDDVVVALPVLLHEVIYIDIARR